MKVLTQTHARQLSSLGVPEYPDVGETEHEVHPKNPPKILGSDCGRTEFSRILFLSRRIFSRIFSLDFFSFLWEKVPRIILQEYPRQNFIQQKSPTHFCRGGRPKNRIVHQNKFFGLNNFRCVPGSCHRAKAKVHANFSKKFVWVSQRNPKGCQNGWFSKWQVFYSKTKPFGTRLFWYPSL